MAFAYCDLEDLLDPEGEYLVEMESDVTHMAQKVSDYRKSLPDNLRNTLYSEISSTHRPDFPNIDSFRSTITAVAESEELPVLSRSGAHLGTEDQESPDRYVQLKETVSGNVTTMPLVVKRMRECKESIDKSNSLNGTIHPAFTRRKAN